MGRWSVAKVPAPHTLGLRLDRFIGMSPVLIDSHRMRYIMKSKKLRKLPQKCKKRKKSNVQNDAIVKIKINERPTNIKHLKNSTIQCDSTTPLWTS